MTIRESARRDFLKTAGTGMAALGVLPVAGNSAFAADNRPVLDMSNNANNFYMSEKVVMQKVTFEKQYEMKVAGNLFTPKGQAGPGQTNRHESHFLRQNFGLTAELVSAYQTSPPVRIPPTGRGSRPGPSSAN
jgi:hypothetical protein